MDRIEACQILGLNTDSFSNKEVKSAWRKQVRSWHPDHNSSDNAIAMVEKINQAYEFLSNPHNNQDPFAVPQYNNQFNQHDFSPETFGQNDPWEEEVPIAQTFPIRGEDTETFISLTTEQAFKGTNLNISLNFLAVCQTCHAEPTLMVNCQSCFGLGRIMSENNKVTLQIPAQSLHKQQIIFPNLGNYGLYGGERGSLIAHVIITQNNNIWEQDDNDLLLKVPISLEELVLGLSINLPTPRGWKNWKIEGPIDLSQEYIVPNCGLESVNDIGDLILDFSLVMPEKLSKVTFTNLHKLSEILDNPFIIQERGNPIDVIEQRLFNWREKQSDLYINDFPITLQEYLSGTQISLSLPHRCFTLKVRPQIDINDLYFIEQAGLPKGEEYGNLYINFILQIGPLNQKQLDAFNQYIISSKRYNPRQELEKYWVSIIGKS